MKEKSELTGRQTSSGRKNQWCRRYCTALSRDYHVGNLGLLTSSELLWLVNGSVGFSASQWVWLGLVRNEKRRIYWGLLASMLELNALVRSALAVDTDAIFLFHFLPFLLPLQFNSAIIPYSIILSFEHSKSLVCQHFFHVFYFNFCEAFLFSLLIIFTLYSLSYVYCSGTLCRRQMHFRALEIQSQYTDVAFVFICILSFISFNFESIFMCMTDF